MQLGLKQEIKEFDREIKEVRRSAATAPTLEEKLSWQKKQRELEGKRSKLRRELFARQDEVEAQRDDLISPLEVQLQQRVEERTPFAVEWEMLCGSPLSRRTSLCSLARAIVQRQRE